MSPSVWRSTGGFGNDELGEVSRLFNLFMDKLQEILRGVVAHTQKLATASQELLDAGEQITINSGETAVQSKSVSRATQQVTQNLQSLSTGAGEMTLTIQSIAANANEAAKVAGSAVSAAPRSGFTTSIMQWLSFSRWEWAFLPRLSGWVTTPRAPSAGSTRTKA